MGSGFDSLSPSMKIFSGNSNRQLAEKICNYLDVDLGKLNISQFSDGELSIAFDENIRNENVFIIQSTNPPAENILELMLILDAAKRASAKTVTLVILILDMVVKIEKIDLEFLFLQELFLIWLLD